jgi:hypothetical protein
MAPPDGAAVSDDAMGLTQRELLMEMREDIKGLKATVDAIARDQALGVERRASMQRSADSIYERLDGHDRDLDRMLAWQNRADGRSSSGHEEGVRVRAATRSRGPPSQRCRTRDGRGERHCPATIDLPITMRLAEPPEPCEWLRSA